MRERPARGTGSAKDLAFAMNDEGKLAATNLNENDPRAESIQKALELLKRTEE